MEGASATTTVPSICVSEPDDDTVNDIEDIAGSNLTPFACRIGTLASDLINGSPATKSYIYQTYANHKLSNKVSPTSEKRQRRLSDSRQGKHIGRAIAVERLLLGGADPSCQDEKLRTPLHFAASKGNKEIAACTSNIGIVTELLRAGTDIQSSDLRGRTPLHLAQARLRILVTDKSVTHDHFKSEVTKVVDMLHAYLARTNMSDLIPQMASMCANLSTVSTSEQVDEFNGLLDVFTHMSLENQRRGVT